jgi:hypothetical protein
MSKNRKIFIAINLFIFITMVIAVISTLIFGGRATRLDAGTTAGAAQLANGTFGGVEIKYWHHIVSFTILSNIFLGLVALIAAIIALKHPKKEFSSKLAATSGMLTCLTVILFLAPMRAISGRNYFDMLLEQMFFLHFLNPILSAICYIFFLNTKEKVGIKPRLLSILPPVIYSSPYMLCVCILKCWPDFYGLTFGGRYYLVPLDYLVVCGIMFGVSSLLAFLHNRYSVTK